MGYKSQHRVRITCLSSRGGGEDYKRNLFYILAQRQHTICVLFGENYPTFTVLEPTLVLNMFCVRQDEPIVHAPAYS